MPATGSELDANNRYISITLNSGGYTYTAVPEPSTIACLGLAGGIALLLRQRRKTRA